MPHWNDHHAYLFVCDQMNKMRDYAHKLKIPDQMIFHLMHDLDEIVKVLGNKEALGEEQFRLQFTNYWNEIVSYVQKLSNHKVEHAQLASFVAIISNKVNHEHMLDEAAS